MHKTFWIGLGILVVGSGPLAAIIALSSLHLLSDPNPNPIGFGLLAMFTFWPGVIITIVGLVQTLRRREPPKLKDP